MSSIIVIGGGISGLSIANMLQSHYEVTIFEAESRPGGLIRCDVVDGNLFHRTGGHVFNTKRSDVLEWFWNRFDKDNEFTLARRRASVAMGDGRFVDYPIENHVYQLDRDTEMSFYKDLDRMEQRQNFVPSNFEEFLRHRFGDTLYELYFGPYNYKVWRRDLTQVPLSWLEGKLPMPTVEEMRYNNANRVEEQQFVHSSFYYPKQGGSQFLADRLAKGLNIRYNSRVTSLTRNGDKWNVNGVEADKIIFCGNIKQLPSLFAPLLDIAAYNDAIDKLESHGTTAVFCKIDKNPYSWVYQPSRLHESHRVICTGNFSSANNADGAMTATIEFTDAIGKEDILDNLKRIPFNPQYLTHNYEKYTYPIQDMNTRSMIHSLKEVLAANGVYLLGRFAEWEYYNMDVAIGAAIDLRNKILG